jgi:serine/threonine protein phosphatase 1
MKHDGRSAARKLSSLLGLHKETVRAKRGRLKLDIADTAVYVIGDVHGCLDELIALEEKICADAGTSGSQALIVMLGDYIDRGPASSQVLDHLIASPPPGFERICLAGNHEVMMLDYLESRIDLAEWAALGGVSTLLSYGIDINRVLSLSADKRIVDDMVKRSVPAPHMTFLQRLPILIETPDIIMVHAGLRPGVTLDSQTDDDLVSIRSAFHEQAHLLRKYVVHGHTPVAAPTRDGRRINIDTGAFFSGRLTALRIRNGKGRYFQN